MKPLSPAGRLYGALAVALVVGAATWRAIARAEAAAEGQSAVTVLVMKKAVPAGRPVTVDALEERRVPDRFAEPGALRAKDEVKALRAARSRIPLAKGEQLTRAKLENEASRLGLAWSVPPGSAAVGLRLPAEAAAGGHVLPGDWVRVLGAEPRGVCRTVVERARVAAVGEKTWDAGAPPPSPAAGLGATESFLVTLILTPDQASRVVSVVERGRLTLALLSPIEDPRP